MEGGLPFGGVLSGGLWIDLAHRHRAYAVYSGQYSLSETSDKLER